jgi:hypothetical protein
MMLVLQQSLNQEREAFFTNRPAFGKEPPTDADKARLERMYHQQGSLAELFDSLSQSLFGSGEGHPLGPGEEGAGPETPPEGEGGDAPPGGAGPEGGGGDAPGNEEDGR